MVIWWHFPYSWPFCLPMQEVGSYVLAKTIDVFVNYQQIELSGSHATPLRFTKAVLTDKNTTALTIYTVHIILQYF